jgi:hypothetical protein
VGSIAEVTESAITVIVPIQIRRRNGRPRIVLTDDRGSSDGSEQKSCGSQAVIRAIARAWDWRRLEAGDVTTHRPIGKGAVGEFRLAYLSPRCFWIKSLPAERLSVFRLGWRG